MNMSTTEKILLIVLGVLILAYIFVYFYGTSPIHNDGSVEVNGKINNSYPAQNLSSIPYNSGESDVNGNIIIFLEKNYRSDKRVALVLICYMISDGRNRKLDRSVF